MRIRFSKTSLLSLPLPSGGRVTVFDADMPKLAVRVTPTGAKTFYVIRRHGGKVSWVKLGAFPEMTVEQARGQAAKVLAEYASGGDPAGARRAARGEPTFAEFFAEYGARHGMKKKTWDDDVQRFARYLAKPLGGVRLSAITRAMVAGVLSGAARGGKSAGTVRNVRALASHMLNMAVDWGYLETNPAWGLKVEGKKVSRTRFLQPAELGPFFEAVAMEGGMMADFILLALLTGARRSNLCAMRREDVDLDAGEWHIPVTKNGEPQTVALCPEAAGILRRRLARGAGEGAAAAGFVFPGRGRTGHLVEPKYAFMRVLARAGIPYGRGAEGGVTLHDLRRTLGSWQARTGASLPIIGKSLNHKSVQSTAVYARLDLGPVRQSVNTATAAMFEAAGRGLPR
jgi:integrase